MTTQYVYGPDGSRTLRVDDAGGTPTTTLYLPQMEIRDVGGTETRIAYPHPGLRVVNGTASYLLRNQLDSVVLVTGSNGTEDFERVYQPFGDTFDWTLDPNAVAEDEGFIGQRRDDDAALIYLNARYLDPKLGMFTQPDWLDVRLAGVGVNRFAYAGNDPVNLSDPGGNDAYSPLDPEHANPFDAFFGSMIGGGGAGGPKGAYAGGAIGVGSVLAAVLDSIFHSSNTGTREQGDNTKSQNGAQPTAGMTISADRASAVLGEKIKKKSQVRFQVQTGKHPNRRTVSSVNLASRTGSVSRLQGQGGLALLFFRTLAEDRNLAMSKGYVNATKELSQWIERVSRSGGVFTGSYQNSFQAEFSYQRRVYQIDVGVRGGVPQLR